MLNVIRVEVIYITLIAAYFVFQHARTRWWRSSGGRQLMLMGVVAFIEHILIVLVASSVDVALWIFILLFGASGAAWTGWLVLIVVVRRRARAETRDQRDELSAT